jgi:hypothetical protein
MIDLIRKEISEQGCFLLSNHLTDNIADALAFINKILNKLALVNNFTDYTINTSLSGDQLLAARNNFYLEMHNADRDIFWNCLERLRDLAAKLLGEEVNMAGRLYVRLIFPSFYDPESHTFAHQDYQVFSGEVDMLTFWVPLINCSRQTSTLQVAKRSHFEGVHSVERTQSSNKYKMYQIRESSNLKWTNDSYNLGDVMIMHSLLVHKSSPNFSNQVRVSFDARFYGKSRRKPVQTPMQSWLNSESKTDFDGALWRKSIFCNKE